MEDKLEEVITASISRAKSLPAHSLILEIVASVTPLINSAITEAREEGESRVWGITYGFLRSRDKDLCNEWDEEVTAELKGTIEQ